MKRIAWLTIFLGVLSTLAWAQQPPRGQVILLPLDVRGDYKPANTGQVQQALLQKVKKLDPQSRLSVAREVELTPIGYTDLSSPPTPDMARQIASAYGVQYVAWASMRVRPEIMDDAAPGRELQLSLATRLWVCRADGQVSMDEVFSVARSAAIKDNQTPAQLQPTGRNLFNSCLDDLAHQIVTVSAQRRNQAMASAWSQPVQAAPAQAQVSKNVRDFSKLAEEYKTALDRADLIRQNDLQLAGQSLWRRLSPAEQNQVEKLYPGTKRWMMGAPFYGVPYYPYHPYYYR